MKKTIIIAFLLGCLPFFTFAQTEDNKTDDPMLEMQEQMLQMMGRMSEQWGGSNLQIDTTFLKNFDHFNLEDLGMGDLPIQMDTLLMRGFSDGGDWIDIHPESGEMDMQELLEQMTKQMEDFGTSFDLEELMEGFDVAPAVPAPEDLKEQKSLDENGQPVKKKKKRKTYSL